MKAAAIWGKQGDFSSSLNSIYCRKCLVRYFPGRTEAVESIFNIPHFVKRVFLKEDKCWKLSTYFDAIEIFK